MKDTDMIHLRISKEDYIYIYVYICSYPLLTNKYQIVRYVIIIA